MPINFDALPSQSPHMLAPEGRYMAVINKAEMRQNKTDASKPPYMNLEMSIKDEAGKSYGKFFDIITESDSDISRYKLRRLIIALGIPMTGSFELKDLCKIIPNKSMMIDLIHENKDGKPPRLITDVFTNEIYYPIKKATGAVSKTESSMPDDDDLPFNASDAEDASAPADATEY